MKILSVNAGSSSLKFKLFELPEEKELVNGTFEKIGLGDSFYTIKFGDTKIKKEVELKDHSDAVKYLIDELLENKIIDSLEDIDGIGNRIVHGGVKFTESKIIDENDIELLKECYDIDPLHNPGHIIGIEAFKKALPNVPQSVVFDTAFHQSMEPTEYLYALPYEWYEKHGIRKYGFHGTSHRFVNIAISKELGRDNIKVINCHLGSGASLCAIDSGRVVDTSMGFTSLAGLMMGTRSGDVDASIIPYIMKKENLTCEEVVDICNKKSGLLGISGVSSDSRDVEEGAASGNERCKLANEMFARRVANYIAMYNNELGGADVITFTAGIGENSKDTRKRICELLPTLGVEIDDERNNIRGEFRLISSDNSKIPVYLVPTNEELMIALDTYNLIKE